jgi:hypothetical protein
MTEVASIPEFHLLKLAGFGPSTIQKVRSIIQRNTTSSCLTADWDDEKLRLEHERVSAKLRDLQDEFRQRERELQLRLRTIRLEFRMRGLSANGTMTDEPK